MKLVKRNVKYILYSKIDEIYHYLPSRGDSLVVSVSAFQAVRHGFAFQPGHTNDHPKDVSNFLPAWH